MKCIYCDNNCKRNDYLRIIPSNISIFDCLHCRCNYYYDLNDNLILGIRFQRQPYLIDISWEFKITTIYEHTKELKTFNYILDITPQNIEYKLKTILNLL